MTYHPDIRSGPVVKHSVPVPLSGGKVWHSFTATFVYEPRHVTKGPLPEGGREVVDPRAINPTPLPPPPGRDVAPVDDGRVGGCQQ